MRRATRVALVFHLLLIGVAGSAETACAAAPAAKASAKNGIAKDGWPTTKAGEVGRGWIAAFAAGDSAMRAFYAQAMSKESLAKRSLEERIANYRKLRERYGTLMLASVVDSKPTELTVALLDADAAKHSFVFKVTKDAPPRLHSIGILEQGHGHGGFSH